MLHVILGFRVYGYDMALSAAHAHGHSIFFAKPPAANAAAASACLCVCQAYECRSIERQREIISELYDEGAV
jgi:hypothetical protein